MINLDTLERAIAATDAPEVAVTRTWLGDVLAELRAGREAALQRRRDEAVAQVCSGLTA